MPSRPSLIGFLFLFLCGSVVGPPCPALAGTRLPENHPYQKALRQYLSTLTEKDFAHGVSADLKVTPSSDDPDYQLRNYLLTLMHQPLVGSKRGPPAINAPPALFTLARIEGDAILVPPVWPETLMSFTQWNYPGNPYYDNRALKLRAFVTASVMLVMNDDFLDNNPAAGRSDKFAYQLVYTGSPYLGVKEILPAEARAAYEAGLKKMARRILDWGVKGEERNLDLIAPVALWYASRAIDDPEFTKETEEFSRKLFTDPQYFHPAGYFLERGGLDVGFQGAANYFACGAALAADWPWAKESLGRVYRLRAHLCLPEPDGKFVGPSNFNTRIGSDAWGDQWAWGGARDFSAALFTDEAAYLARLPSPEALKEAVSARVSSCNHQIHENPVKSSGPAGYVYTPNDELTGHPWLRRQWTTFNFPGSMNFGHEFYKPGTYARLKKLETENSPLLKSPFQRDELFIRDFERTFLVARQPGYAAILHTGPVGTQDPADGLFQYSGPLGMGGGELSAFWTPATGSVLLGRRAGMTFSKLFDQVEEWRTWPSHAVSGCTTAGKFFTSGRIARPEVKYKVAERSANVKVGGTIPAEAVAGYRALDGKLDYSREFQLDNWGPTETFDRGMSIETTISGDGKDQIAELYEVFPVFLREAALQPTATPTRIEFLTGGEWTPATDKYVDATAVKLRRFGGAVRITFDRPRRVKLSPADWADTFISRATCRNVLVDLLEGDQPASVKEPRKFAYHLGPETK